MPEHIKPAAMPGQAAAAYLGVGLSSLYSLANTNQIDSFTSGRRRLFVTDSIDRYIERRRAAEGGSFTPQSLPWQRPQTETPRRKRRERRSRAAEAAPHDTS